MIMSNKGKAGSQLDLQIAVNTNNGEALSKAILSLNPEWEGGKITWFSPLKETGYKEFFDKSFFNGSFGKKKGVSESFWDGVKMEGTSFETIEKWPKGGPHWDGIAVLEKNGKNTLLMIEAKAHKGEVYSYCGAKGESRECIKDFLNDILGKKMGKEDYWLKKYYQFANRLAFHFSLKEAKVNVSLIYILFANDPYWCEYGDSMQKDFTGESEWKKSLKKQRDYFGFTDDESLKEKNIYELIVDLEKDPFSAVLEEINSCLINNINKVK